MGKTISVDLGNELREFVESLVESGDYRTQSEVIRESLRLLREKQAESHLHMLKSLLVDELSGSGTMEWKKYAFLTEVEMEVDKKKYGEDG